MIADPVSLFNDQQGLGTLLVFTIAAFVALAVVGEHLRIRLRSVAVLRTALLQESEVLGQQLLRARASNAQTRRSIETLTEDIEARGKRIAELTAERDKRAAIVAEELVVFDQTIQESHKSWRVIIRPAGEDGGGTPLGVLVFADDAASARRRAAVRYPADQGYSVAEVTEAQL